MRTFEIIAEKGVVYRIRVDNSGIVVESTEPDGRWLIGKDLNYIMPYFQFRGWRFNEIQQTTEAT